MFCLAISRFKNAEIPEEREPIFESPHHEVNGVTKASGPTVNLQIDREWNGVPMLYQHFFVFGGTVVEEFHFSRVA